MLQSVIILNGLYPAVCYFSISIFSLSKISAALAILKKILFCSLLILTWIFLRPRSFRSIEALAQRRPPAKRSVKKLLQKRSARQIAMQEVIQGFVCLLFRHKVHHLKATVCLRAEGQSPAAGTGADAENGAVVFVLAISGCEQRIE